MKEWFIPGNVPSSKNSRRWTGRYFIASKTTMKYRDETDEYWKKYKRDFVAATDELLTVEAKNKKDSKKRTVGLYNKISLDHIVAEYNHGLLKLTLPKKGVHGGKEIKIT